MSHFYEYLNEERINIKKMSVEELTKNYLKKSDGNEKKAIMLIKNYMSVMEKGDVRLEKLQHVLNNLQTPTKLVSTGYSLYRKKDGVNPTLEKMKVELEKEKKSNSVMTFNELPNSIKKIVAKHGAGENSTILNKGNDWKKALGSNVLYITNKEKNKQFVVVPSLTDKSYNIYDAEGKAITWKNHIYKKPTKMNNYKGKHIDIDNPHFKASQNMYSIFGDNPDILEIGVDKIRQHMDAERSTERTKMSNTNPNSDISDKVIDKYMGSANKKVEDALLKKLSDIISKTGTDEFDAEKVRTIEKDLYDLHNAKSAAKKYKGKKLYDKASYEYNYETNKTDTSKLSSYGKPSLTYAGKDIIGKINRILGKGK